MLRERLLHRALERIGPPAPEVIVPRGAAAQRVGARDGPQALAPPAVAAGGPLAADEVPGPTVSARAAQVCAPAGVAGRRARFPAAAEHRLPEARGRVPADARRAVPAGADALLRDGALSPVAAARPPLRRGAALDEVGAGVALARAASLPPRVPAAARGREAPGQRKAVRAAAALPAVVARRLPGVPEAVLVARAPLRPGGLAAPGERAHPAAPAGAVGVAAPPRERAPVQLPRGPPLRAAVPRDRRVVRPREADALLAPVLRPAGAARVALPALRAAAEGTLGRALGLAPAGERRRALPLVLARDAPPPASSGLPSFFPESKL